METLSDRPLRVLIRHSSPLFSAGLAALLGAQADFDVEVFPGNAARQDPGARSFDVLVADLEAALGAPGERLFRPLFERGREKPRLLVVASDYSPAEVRLAIQSGACGFLAAKCTAQELHAAVRAVGDGLRYVCEEAAGTMVDGTRRPALTGRQAEVLRLLAQGWPNKSIAKELGLAPETVKSHVSHIMERLGAGSRLQAASLALKQGLVAQARPEAGTPSRRIVRQGHVVAQIPGVHAGGSPLGRASTPFFPC